MSSHQERASMAAEAGLTPAELEQVEAVAASACFTAIAAGVGQQAALQIAADEGLKAVQKIIAQRRQELQEMATQTHSASTGRAGCSKAVRPAKVQTWQERHYSALYAPTEAEAPIVNALKAAAGLAEQFGGDYLLRNAVAQILISLQRLLEGVPHERLDRGLMDGEIIRIASRINYDMDTEKFL